VAYRSLQLITTLKHLEKVYKIQQNNMWNEVRELYLYKKNINTDSHKKSRSLYAETVKEIYDLIE